MTTGQKFLLVVGVGGAAWTIFYFAYWQGRNAVKPADVTVLAQSTVAAGSAAPSIGAVAAMPASSIAGINISEISSALST